MGKRMGKKWDLPPGSSKALGILCLAFFLGGAAGCLFAGFADDSGARELSAYLADYLRLLLEGSVTKYFWPSVWGQLRYLLVVVLLGITALGVLGIPVLFVLRGFFFSFSVACFLRVFGKVGLVPALFLFGLPALLWSPALFLTGTQGLVSSQGMLRQSMGGERSFGGFGPLYWPRIGLCLLLAVLCGLLEYMSIPVLLRAAARFVL